MKQESYSSSSSSPTAGEIQVRERDATNSDISPVPMSNLVDDGPGKPDEIQANINLKTKKENHDRTRQPVRFKDPGMAARIQGKFGG